MDNVPQNITVKTNPSYEHWRKKDPRLVQSKVKKGFSAQSTAKLIAVLIIIMVLLVLVTLALAALSVTAYRQLTSEHLQVLNQLNETKFKIGSDQGLLFTNILQVLTWLDTRITYDSEILNQINCRPGLWYRVASLNMSDPSQQCPSAWREYNNSGVRACGRRSGCCSAILYFSDHRYSQVCGRVIGYQVASPDVFNAFPNNEIGLDGVTITYGTQRNHIWSYVAGVYETKNSPSNCPCSSQQARMPPQLIGDNYYCESGNPNDSFKRSQFFINDKLWDGHQCEGTCCNGTNSPPWFSVQLPAPTRDVIEVRICLDQGITDEDTPIELLEIYVQ